MLQIFFIWKIKVRNDSDELFHLSFTPAKIRKVANKCFTFSCFWLQKNETEKCSPSIWFIFIVYIVDAVHWDKCEDFIEVIPEMSQKTEKPSICIPLWEYSLPHGRCNQKLWTLPHWKILMRFVKLSLLLNLIFIIIAVIDIIIVISVNRIISIIRCYHWWRLFFKQWTTWMLAGSTWSLIVFNWSEWRVHSAFCSGIVWSVTRQMTSSLNVRRSWNSDENPDHRGKTFCKSLLTLLVIRYMVDSDHYKIIEYINYSDILYNHFF